MFEPPQELNNFKRHEISELSILSKKDWTEKCKHFCEKVDKEKLGFLKAFLFVPSYIIIKK